MDTGFQTRLSITYEDPFGLWDYFQMETPYFLPLRQIQWKQISGAPRSVLELEANLVPFHVTFIREPPSPPPVRLSRLYQKPLFHLFFVWAESTKFYNAEVKPQLEKWLDIVQFEEFCVLYMPMGREPGSQHSGDSIYLPNMNAGKQHRKVFEKLRNDVGAKSKRERALRVYLSSSKAIPEKQSEGQWTELGIRVREGVVVAAERTLEAYEEEIRRLNLRQMARKEWDFSSYFLIKEGMACFFETLGMFDIALKIYIELSTLIDEAVHGLPFGELEAAAASESVLAVNMHKMRDLMLADRASEFLLRTYVFSRECTLLFRQDEVADVAVSAEIFIRAMGKRLSDMQPNSLFPEVWVFSACMAVTSACEEYFGDVEPNVRDPSVMKLNDLLGHLYLYARGKVEQVYEKWKRLPKAVRAAPPDPAAHAPPPSFHAETGAGAPDTPSGDSLLSPVIKEQWTKIRARGVTQVVPEVPPSPPAPLPAPMEKKESTSPSAVSSEDTKLLYNAVLLNSDLSTAVSCTENFDSLFVKLTDAAARKFSDALRSRSVQRLQGEKAELFFKREQYESAESLLKSVFTMYYMDGWYDLAYSVKTQLAECQRRLGHYDQYIVSCLGMLSPEFRNRGHDNDFFVKELCRVARSGLKEELRWDLLRDVRMKEVKLKWPKGRVFTTAGNLVVAFVFDWPLSASLETDTVSVLLTGQEGASRFHITLEARGVSIEPGVCTYVISERVQKAGKFLCESLRFTIGKLTLAHPLLDTPEDRTISIVPKSASATIDMLMESEMFYLQTQYLVLVFHANEDTVQKASVYFAGFKMVLNFSPDAKCVVLEAADKDTPIRERKIVDSYDVSSASSGMYKVGSLQPGQSALLLFNVTAPASSLTSCEIEPHVGFTDSDGQTFELCMSKSTHLCAPLHVTDRVYANRFVEEKGAMRGISCGVQISLASSCKTKVGIAEARLVSPDNVRAVFRPDDIGAGLSGNMGPCPLLYFMEVDSLLDKSSETTTCTLELRIEPTRESSTLSEMLKLADVSHSDMWVRKPIILPQAMAEGYVISTVPGGSNRVGSAVDFTFNVRHLTSSDNTERKDCYICAEIEDSDNWLLSGKRKEMISHKPGGRFVLHRVFTPTCGGYVALPRVLLRSAGVYVVYDNSCDTYFVDYSCIAEVDLYASGAPSVT